MNLDKLRQAEHSFLEKYPGGFNHPDLVELAKKHKMDTLIHFAQKEFTQIAFNQPTLICDKMIKLINRSSMISVFEKPKFKNFITTANDADIQSTTLGLYEQLFGNPQKGLERMVNTLRPAKLGKWSLTTIIPNYFKPHEEVFIKPTTAKGVIDFFELEDLNYKPQPTWEFYQKYRDSILDMKAKVDPSLCQSNAAFSGFLMMSLPNTH